MRKLNDKEQQLLLQLMRSCEYYHLNETQSIGCINKILKRNISRRTYYSYKSKLYEDDIFNKLKESIYSSPLDRISVILLNDVTDLEVKAKVNKLIAGQFTNKDNLSPIQSQYYDESHENMKDKVKDVLTKNRHLKEMENLTKNRLNYIPKNATIREEFVKCGKVTCDFCPHGPYYYAYWKEKTNDNKSKLRKKYGGTMDPRQ